MRAFLINGSPKGRKSNTYQLAEAFLSGLQPEEVREAVIPDLDIRLCLGCLAYWNKTPGMVVIPPAMI